MVRDLFIGRNNEKEQGDVLLLAKLSQQWYAYGRAMNIKESPNLTKFCGRVTMLVLILAMAASIILFISIYISAKNEIRDSSSNYYSRPSTYQPSQYSASSVTADALANVRSRYRQRLSRFGLQESYYDETNGICDLMLLDVDTWTKYEIVYYRASGQLNWPGTMPKDVAEQFMFDRMLIDTYEKTSR